METIKHANLSLVTAFHPKVCPSPVSFEVILTTRRIVVVRFHYFHLFNFDALRSMGSPFSGLKRVPIYSTEKITLKVASGISGLVKMQPNLPRFENSNLSNRVSIFLWGSLPIPFTQISFGIFTNSCFWGKLSAAKRKAHVIGELGNPSKMYIFKPTHAVSTCLARSLPTIYFWSCIT